MFHNLLTTSQVKVDGEINHIKLAKYSIFQNGGSTGADIQPTLSLLQLVKPNWYPYIVICPLMYFKNAM